jgi:prolyl-tRNA synthetase
VIIVSVKPKSPEVKDASERIYAALLDAGVDVILDDRDERPGIKFKDADLIGIPLRITVGTKVKDSYVDVKLRKSREAVLVKVEEIVKKVREMINSD